MTRHVKGPDVWPGVAGPHQGMWPDATRSGMRRQGMRTDVARCGLMLDVVVVEFRRCIHGQCGPNRQLGPGWPGRTQGRAELPQALVRLAVLPEAREFSQHRRRSARRAPLPSRAETVQEARWSTCPPHPGH